MAKTLPKPELKFLDKIEKLDICPKCRALVHMQPCGRCHSIGWQIYYNMGGIPFTRAIREENLVKKNE